MSDLIVLENVNPLEIFTVDGVDPLLGKIKEEVSKFKPDMTTAKGRKEIASMASKVARLKTYLDGLGKDLTADWKQKAKVVDESRRKIRAELDQLKEDVRRPLTEWEETEKERVAELERRLNQIVMLSDSNYFDQNNLLADLKDRNEKIKAVIVDDSWKEFQVKAKEQLDKSITLLHEALTREEDAEKQRQELARMKAEEEERKRKEREAQIAKEAEERARKEAEEKARLEKEKVEREKQEALAREQKIKAEKEEAEKRVKEAEERAKQEKIEAEKRAKREKEEAIQAERRRVEAQKQKEQEEQKRREENTRIRKTANNNVKKVLMKEGFTEQQAERVVVLIAKGELPKVTITY